MNIKLINRMTLILSLLGTAPLSAAQTPEPPQDPAQSITYWKPYTVKPETDADVARAHDIFANLLRAWDRARIEPTLHVVESAAGAWAASLADGNILLSRAAIDVSRRHGSDRADALLAFVLAHELAHQRANDLWHRQFFRIARNQSADVKRLMLKGLPTDANQLADLERREAQADRDGLILMATVGYDPFQIVERKDFFTAWVENLWQGACGDNGTAPRDACEQARARALRARTQLAATANQTLLYQMGIQAFVAGHYEQARRYFTAFGRDYPSRAVHEAIGQTHLMQAIALEQELVAAGAWPGPALFYPVLLDARPDATPQPATALTQRGGDAYTRQLEQRLRISVDHAVAAFEKAVRLEPDHRSGYLALATAYLLARNAPMARGVLQGNYLPRFGDDASLALLLAMTRSLEGDLAQARREWEKLMTRDPSGPLPAGLLMYAGRYNYAAVLGALKEPDAEVWRQFAQRAQSGGDGLLFLYALDRLGRAPTPARTPSAAPTIRNARPGLRAAVDKNDAVSSDELWLDGQPLRARRYADGARMVADDGKVIALWQDGGAGGTLLGVNVGDAADRPLKLHGMPTRLVHLVSGEYLAYDRIGVAFRIANGKVAGWFLYDPASRS
jgi:tetratricopeptide (TPR) repeat protein